jgi:hypothetical protein
MPIDGLKGLITKSPDSDFTTRVVLASGGYISPFRSKDTIIRTAVAMGATDGSWYLQFTLIFRLGVG